MFKKWNLKITALICGATSLVLFTLSAVGALILNQIAAIYINKSDAMFWQYQSWSHIAQTIAMSVFMIGITSEIIIGAVGMYHELKDE